MAGDHGGRHRRQAWSNPARPSAASSSPAISTRPTRVLIRLGRRCPGWIGPRLSAAAHKDGRKIEDNLGRLVNGRGEPVSEDGETLARFRTDAPLPPAPRTKLCQEGVKVASLRDQDPRSTSSWYSYCGGEVRKLINCCSTQQASGSTGTRPSEGYCFKGRKVFCVMYFDTNVPC